MDEESQNVKHLKLERRRRQFEATSRYGRPGATRRKARDLNSNMELEIIRPTNSDFLVLTTEVDSAWALPLHDKHGLTGLRLEEFERRSHGLLDWILHPAIWLTRGSSALLQWPA